MKRVGTVVVRQSDHAQKKDKEGFATQLSLKLNRCAFTPYGVSPSARNQQVKEFPSKYLIPFLPPRRRKKMQRQCRALPKSPYLLLFLWQPFARIRIFDGSS